MTVTQKSEPPNCFRCGYAGEVETLTDELETANKYKQDFFDAFHCIIDGAGHENEFAIKWRNEEINIIEAVEGYVNELKTKLNQEET